MDALYLLKKEMLRRNYSSKTIKTYLDCVKQFLKTYKGEIRKISKSDVKDYLEQLEDKTGSTKNVHLSALIFLMKHILNKNFVSKIKYSRMPKTLPVVLSREEISLLINSIDNEKHKLIVKLLYGSGLRVNEIVNLRARDLDLENNYGWVRGGKGNKDRMFIIPKMLTEEIKKLVENKDYDSYIFDSHNGHLSSRSIQEIIKKAAKRAGIRKRVHPHTLRHSYATHLIENGYDIAAVQSLLGHNSPNTTMIYLHTAAPTLLKVRSPLDDLQQQNNAPKQDYEPKETPPPSPRKPE
jgi:integrase/recombinase XerD